MAASPPEGASGSTRRKCICFKLAASFILTIALIEGGLRLLDWRAGRGADFFVPKTLDYSQSMFQPHPFIPYVLRPGFASQRDASIHINSLGMRGKELSADKPEGTYRIFCIGGSTTFGTSVSDDAHTYPSQLETMLNRTAPENMKYEVANCGVSGYTSVENLIQLELKLIDYRPDAVIFYEGINDARIIQSRGFRSDYSNMRQAWSPERISPFEEFLLRHFRIYAWLARGTDPEQQLGVLTDFVFVPQYRIMHIRSDVRINDIGIPVFMRNMKHMLLVCKSHSIAPVLSTFAIHEEPSPTGERYTEIIARLNEQIRAFGESEHIPVLEIAGKLNDQKALFTDDVHLNDEGSRRHAEIVAEQAAALKLFNLR
ncbi:MAG: SGNH/GDSL hydrolase family protein [Planctomycetes bacterium]|nr:SGNH/GDSL hydrolase family protein [Planctomycetota bacterium]